MELRVYHMGRFVQVWYCAIGLGLIGAGVFPLFKVGLVAIVVALPFVLAGGYCCRRGLNSRLALSETEISVRYAFSEKSVQRSEIEGWRTDVRGKSGTCWALQRRDDSGEFTIDQGFAVDDAFLDYLSGLTNLNEGETSIIPR
jgi:hypothetical protein